MILQTKDLSESYFCFSTDPTFTELFLQSFAPLPSVEITDASDEHTLPRLIECLEQRQRARHLATEEVKKSGM